MAVPFWTMRIDTQFDRYYNIACVEQVYFIVTLVPKTLQRKGIILSNGGKLIDEKGLENSGNCDFGVVCHHAPCHNDN